MAWLIYILLSVIPLTYWYLTRNFKYWSKRGIKGPKPIPGFGNLLDFFITPQPIHEVNLFKKYGKIYGYYMGNKPILTVAEPELIKTILVKDFHIFPDRRLNRSLHPITSRNLVDVTGDDWKRIRSIVSPTFTSGKMRKMYPSIRDCLKDFMSNLDSYANDRKDINAKDMFGNLTMDVIATCAFATKVDSQKEQESPFVVNAKKAFNLSIIRLILALTLPVSILKMTGILNGNSGEARDFFLNSVRHIITTRRKSGQKFNDFVQLLIDADQMTGDADRTESDVNESHHVNEGTEEIEIQNKILNISLKDKYLSEAEILANAFVFLMAGYETTATTLTYCTYELALNQGIQDKLFDEVNGAVDSNGEISYEVLATLPYLDAVLSETLRLHSPAIRLSRTASAQYKLAGTDITLEEGQTVEIPIYGIHHSEEFYPEPFKFNPDRFLPENRLSVKPYTYLPFGAGPRNCIGMRFALMEAKLALVHLIRKYRFFRSPQTDVPLLPKRVFRLNTPKRIIVGIEYRV